MSNELRPQELVNAPLGQTSAYPERYDASLLFPIPRAQGRQHLSLQPQPEWFGEDVWRAFEVSWLNLKGKPEVAILRFTIPASSPNIIESKSFKLYLNSFNQWRINQVDLLKIMQRDLSDAAGAPVSIAVESALTPITPALQAVQASNALGAAHLPQQEWPLPSSANKQDLALEAIYLDDLDIECNEYEPNADLLALQGPRNPVSETFISELLKSNCPVTGQPDWATLVISYTGPAIDQAALLRYIVSYRHHSGFHEQCVEQIYCDIWQRCQPEYLDVYARYTRRGGLDINPRRRSLSTPIVNVHVDQTVRTPRQ